MVLSWCGWLREWRDTLKTGEMVIHWVCRPWNHLVGGVWLRERRGQDEVAWVGGSKIGEIVVVGTIYTYL